MMEHWERTPNVPDANTEQENTHISSPTSILFRQALLSYRTTVTITLSLRGQAGSTYTRIRIQRQLALTGL